MSAAHRRERWCRGAHAGQGCPRSCSAAKPPLTGRCAPRSERSRAMGEGCLRRGLRAQDAAKAARGQWWAFPGAMPEGWERGNGSKDCCSRSGRPRGGFGESGSSRASELCPAAEGNGLEVVARVLDDLEAQRAKVLEMAWQIGELVELDSAQP
jgi:hypothetical protein